LASQFRKVEKEEQLEMEAGRISARIEIGEATGKAVLGMETSLYV